MRGMSALIDRLTRPQGLSQQHRRRGVVKNMFHNAVNASAIDPATLKSHIDASGTHAHNLLLVTEMADLADRKVQKEAGCLPTSR